MLRALQIEHEPEGCVDVPQIIEREVAGRGTRRAGSIAAVCSAMTRVVRPPISTSGRKLAARADVDVGATSQVESRNWSDWTTTA